MTPEPPALLPFADALDQLCSRGLIQELRQAEQIMKRLTQQLAATGSDIPADEGEAKRRQGEMRRAQSELARALFVLRSDLADRVRRGEFHIQARRADPGTTDTAVVIPLAALPTLSIDPEARTISTAEGDYAEINAVLGPAPSSTEESPPRCLPLWDALVRWCSPVILCDIRRNERCFSAVDLREFEHPTLGAAGDGMEKLSRHAYPHVRERLEFLWEDLTRDFKRRIERGEVYLQGVQMRPELRDTHETIPSTWAGDFRFDWAANAITVARRRYVAVICLLGPPSVSTSPARTNVNQVADVVRQAEEANEPPVNGAGPEGKRRGRPAYQQAMEGDLRDNWDDVQRRAAKNPSRMPVWSDLAKQMHKRMEAVCRKAGHGNAPAVGTVRKNLPSIYARLLEEKTAR
jgi:hypothetical protein